MPNLHECLFCGVQITPDNESKEHVIPNALGGQLWTKEATCSSCNSKAGHSLDGHLVSTFSLLANVLDVPRDRGTHPKANVKDSVTGLNYELSPGRKPVLAHNISVRREPDKAIHYEFFAPTEMAAEEVLKRNLPKRKKFLVEKFAGRDHSGERYALGLCQVEFANTDLLRGIAKIAACYARHMGLTVPSSAVAPTFMRSASVPLVPVAVPISDVVSIPGLGAHPLHHAVFLYRPTDSRHLFAYVCLFHAFEFVVLVDDNSNAMPGCCGYLWNIVTARPEGQDFSWVATTEQILKWINGNTANSSRPGARSVSLTHWIKDVEAVWIQRAMASAKQRFQQRKSEGASDADALEHMRAEMDNQLAAYGLSVGDLEITRQ